MKRTAPGQREGSVPYLSLRIEEVQDCQPVSDQGIGNLNFQVPGNKVHWNVLESRGFTQPIT
jgi:hypothetical protein